MKFTQEDLLNAMGLKVGDIITSCGDEKLFDARVIELNRVPCLSWSDGYVYDISRLVGREYTVITPPKYTLTETEKHIVLAIDEKWKYIVRDNDDGLWVADGVVWKHDFYWGSDYYDMSEIEPFNQHFQFIQWSDTEPVSLDELRQIAKGETK